MADFFKKCSIKIWGEDTYDLAGLITEELANDGVRAIVICESCGPTFVNHLGECTKPNCEECSRETYDEA